MSQPQVKVNHGGLRVLIVDNNPRRREQLVHNLSQHDFTLFVAQGEGQALLADARHKVMENFCQVAVVTPRLLNPADPEDFSGLGLGQQLAPAGVVIFAPDTDDEIAYRAGLMHMGYYRQGHPIERLIEAVVQQAQHRQIRIEWPVTDFHRHVAEALKIKERQVTTDHLQDLLGRTFPEAIRLVLKPLPSLETAALAATPVRRAVVLWAQEHRPLTNTLFTPKVVKIGTKDHIEREVVNYKRYVEGRLRQERQARLEGHALVWHLGAIAYAFLGTSPGELDSFRRYYTQRTPPQVLAVLRRLFTDTCHAWYHDERHTLPQARLYDLYNEALDLDNHLNRLDREHYRLAFEGLPEDLPNPALWAIREGRETAFERVTTCIAHGDLHGDNFFVDKGDMTWLIDFEHTGPAHALRDFVELEADIKLRLAQYPADDLPALAALERSLLTGQTLGAMLLPAWEVLQHPGLYKTFQVIAGIRHLAHLATGVTRLPEYYHALLYETLFMASLTRLRQAVRERALLSAALIVERLTARTGLLRRGGRLVPRLDTGLLQDPTRPARAMVAEHQKYLRACYQTAELQQALYEPEPPPPELLAGIAEIRQEAARLGAAQLPTQD